MEIDVLTLIPQRPPFVVVDVLESCGLTDAVTRFTVDSDCLFVADGELSAVGVMENMAQSCAARIGYIVRREKRKDNKRKDKDNKRKDNKRKDKDEEKDEEVGLQMDETGIGVIGDISGFEVLRRPKVGETVRTRIEVVEQVMNLTLAEVRMDVGDEMVGRARMKIAVRKRTD